MSVDRWVLISELGGDPFVRSLRLAINKAVADSRMTDPGQDIDELACHLSTKLDMLPRIETRIRKNCHTLKKEVQQRDPSNDYQNGRNGKALNVANDLKHELLIDIDLFAF